MKDKLREVGFVSFLLFLGYLNYGWVFNAFGASHTQKQPASSNSHQAPETDQRGTDSMPLSIKLLNTGKSDKESAQEADAVHETITLTEALVAATVLQFIALIWQGRWIRRSVRAAENALTNLERPYIYVDIATSAASGGDFEGLYFHTVKIICRNYGRSPAILVERATEDACVPTGALPKPLSTTHGILLPEGTAVGAGGESRYKFDKAVESYARDHRKVEEGTHDFFIHGWVRYHDLFGGSHITGFCAKLFRERKRFKESIGFEFTGGKEHNYTRDET